MAIDFAPNSFGRGPVQPGAALYTLEGDFGFNAANATAPAIAVNDESAASIAKGEVICCGGNANTSRIGTSSVRIRLRLGGVQLLGGFEASKTQSASRVSRPD